VRIARLDTMVKHATRFVSVTRLNSATGIGVIVNIAVLDPGMYIVTSRVYPAPVGHATAGEEHVHLVNRVCGANTATRLPIA